MLHKTGTPLALVFALALSPTLAGCNVGPKHWIEDQREFSIPAASLEQLEVLTHNGDVQVIGQTDVDQVAVKVRIRAGGATPDDAQAALDAIDLRSETAGAAHKLHWKWIGDKAPSWGASVAFDVELPGRLVTRVETHNGKVTARDLAAKTSLKSHNGGVMATHLTGPIDVETHNGRIEVQTSNGDIALRTHNGRVAIDTRGAANLAGQVVSHNGGLRVRVDPTVSTVLSCETHNGSIDISLPLQSAKMSKHKVTGTLGDGGGTLHLETHNGSIHVRTDGD